MVTFLFTDVEVSTRRCEADADRMRWRWPPVTTRSRSVIETYGGRLFRHTGNGACAAFSSPKSCG